MRAWRGWRCASRGTRRRPPASGSGLGAWAVRRWVVRLEVPVVVVERQQLDVDLVAAGPCSCGSGARRSVRRGPVPRGPRRKHLRTATPAMRRVERDMSSPCSSVNEIGAHGHPLGRLVPRDAKRWALSRRTGDGRDVDWAWSCRASPWVESPYAAAHRRSPTPHRGRVRGRARPREAGARQDGAAPLSEQFRLSARSRDDEGVVHLLAIADGRWLRARRLRPVPGAGA